MTSSSAHFRYHAREGDEHACVEVHDALERHLEMMTEYLEIEWPGDAIIDYYKFLDHDDYQDNSGCPERSGGCFGFGAVRASQAFDPHELIHAYTVTAWGNSTPMLVEGIAVALSCSPWGLINRSRRWQDAFSMAAEAREDGYVLAGALVTHLLTEHGGVKKLRQLYESLSVGSLELSVQAAFEDVYGVDLDTVWSTLLERPEIPACLPLWACAADELAASDEVGPTCAGSGERVFHMDAPSKLVTEGLRLRAVACDGSSINVRLSGGVDGGAVRGEHWLPALGRRFALTRIGAGFDIEHGHTPTRTELQAVPPWSSAACAELDPIRLRSDTVTTFVMPEAGQLVRVSADPEERFGVLAHGAQRCDDCGGEGCTDLVGYTSLPGLDSAILRMRQPLYLGVVSVTPEPLASGARSTQPSAQDR
ncbi:hypothetical protein [Sorangium sp. So ce1335]|uniref:hypothetical protein n=1 Tax=Sorangium sp. So ce1335 TaxID=3133335 RepID=UPI003F5F572C